MIDSYERVQRELKRIKVVNNQDNVFDTPIDRYDMRENSRYGKWKNQMETNGYQR